MSIKSSAKRALLAVFNESLVSHAAWRFRRLKYGGTRFECPCCGGQFREFLPGIDSLKADHRSDGILCPECNSLTRQRLIFLYLRDELRIFERPCRILHVAPERCLTQIFAASPNIDYVSADLESPLAAVKTDLTNSIFRDDVFDVVICSHVLEHIPDDRGAVQEMVRILKPGGVALLLVPLDAAREITYEDPGVQSRADRLRAFGQEDHVRVYGRDFVARLRQPGATLEAVSCAQLHSPERIDRFRLDPDELIFVCKKNTPVL
jgi:SAM-dependent methyltransferase